MLQESQPEKLPDDILHKLQELMDKAEAKKAQ